MMKQKFPFIIKVCGFKNAVLVLLSVLLFNSNIDAQKELNVISNWIEFSDAPNSLYHYLAEQAYEQLDKREKKIAQLHSLNDWQQRQQWLRKTLLKVVGPFPEKTPLNAKIVRTINKDEYKIEHIVFESQSQLYVTSSLFIPASLRANDKAPAVIYCSGHSNEAYRNAVYQKAILNLVEKGFIVFAFDPVGQGERLQYFDSTAGKSFLDEPDKAHSYTGAQAFITGSSLARYMIWDGIRAVDYLLTRKEVDPERIGITGRSGGGTQSAYIAAFDDRIKAVATESYITSFRRLIQSAGPQDAEQDFFHGIEQGIDMADLLSVWAPKPALVISTTQDATFNIQGAIETVKEVSKIYEAYGKKNEFGMVTDDAPHASTKKDREAIYAFFQKQLENPGDSTDKDVELLSASELQVTKTGQVTTTYKNETVYSLNKKETEKLETNLQTSRKNISLHLSETVEAAKKLSGYHPPLTTDEPVFTGRFQKEGYVIEKYFIKGEGDYVIPYLLLKPDHPNHKALIYLNPSGKSAEALAGGELEWFTKNGFTVLAPDLLGFGEMGPGSFRGDSYIKNISYNVWFLSMLIGRSIAGVQAADVVKLADLLKKDKQTSEIYGLAIKEISPVLLHAAAFDTAITHVALIEPYSSYRSIVMNRFYDPAYIHSTVAGALQSYDLPDLAATLAPRKLMLLNVKDGKGNSISSENEDLSIIEAAYHYKNTDEKLEINSAKSEEEIKAFYNEWIR